MSRHLPISWAKIGKILVIVAKLDNERLIGAGDLPSGNNRKRNNPNHLFYKGLFVNLLVDLHRDAQPVRESPAWQRQNQGK
jgi:hypothetical protein